MSAIVAGKSNGFLQRCLTNVKTTLQSKRYVKPDLRNIKEKEAKRKNISIKKKGYLLLTIPAAAFGLGVWQVERRKWKNDLIKRLEETTNRPPVPLPKDYRELDGMEYQKVKVSGKFDHSRETYILPRANVQAASNMPGASGAYVVTPFCLENDDVILVNRGWVPKSKLDPKTRSAGQVEGTVEITGIIRKTEAKSSYIGNKSAHNDWHSRDVEGMARQLGTLPIFVDADKECTEKGGPVGGQTKITLRNDHLQYLITWFSLSAATLFMWFKWMKKL